MNIPEELLPDLLLENLKISERLLVITARLWVSHQKYGDMPNLPDWRGGLCAVGLSDIVEEVVDPMLQIIVASHLLFRTRPVNCRLMTTHEGYVLNGLSLLQHQQKEQAEATFEQLLLPSALKVVIPLASRLTTAMLIRHLPLPLRKWPKGRQVSYPAKQGLH